MLYKAKELDFVTMTTILIEYCIYLIRMCVSVWNIVFNLSKYCLENVEVL